MKKVSVAAIDDHGVALAGLHQLLRDSTAVELVATYHSVADLQGDVGRPAIDVVMLDLRLKDGSDPYFNVQALREEGMEVLIFSSLESPYFLRRALQAGVSGVVDKTSSTAVIVDAIATAARHELYPTAEWAGVIDSDSDFTDVHLSERQREVLELYAMGESARRVAEITNLSPETVQDYISRIRTKYAVAGRDASNKIDLFRRAQEDGYVPGPWEA